MRGKEADTHHSISKEEKQSKSIKHHLRNPWDGLDEGGDDADQAGEKTPGADESTELDLRNQAIEHEILIPV